MYYLVYKITNLINKKYYIGARKTEIIDDNYMGSGKLIKKAISKHGLENFKKEILYIFDNPNDMFEKEKELISEEEVLNTQCYNLKIGGYGGWDHIDNVNHNIKINKLRNYNDPKFKKKLSESAKRSMKIRMDKGEKPFKNSKGFLNKKHSEETKKIISEKNKGRVSSTKNKIWINNNKERKIINPKELKFYLNDGWKQGRKILTTS